MTRKLEKIYIAVFAHNEQKNIIRCLESICDSTTDKNLLKVTVLINGSTDSTLSMVDRFCQNNPGFGYMDIELGDKANAWNIYIHSQHDDGQPHFFLDGDNWLPASSMDYINMHWNYNESIALATIPIGVSEGLRQLLIENSWISGNFYGLSPRFINAIKSQNFRIPVGFIGEDSLVTYLLETGLESEISTLTDDERKDEITVLNTVGPVVPKISMSPSSISMLHNRYKRYALRHFQQEVFYYLARSRQMEKLPVHASGLKVFLGRIGIKPYLKFVGIQTIYHPYAITRMILTKPT